MNSTAVESVGGKKNRKRHWHCGWMRGGGRKVPGLMLDCDKPRRDMDSGSREEEGVGESRRNRSKHIFMGHPLHFNGIEN